MLRLCSGDQCSGCVQVISAQVGMRGRLGAALGGETEGGSTQAVKGKQGGTGLMRVVGGCTRENGQEAELMGIVVGQHS